MPPHRVTSIHSWQRHIPFDFSIVRMLGQSTRAELGTHCGD